MIHKVGLIARDNDQSLAFAYKLYARTDSNGVALAAGFKRSFSRSVTIDFVGVFDTVASVGLILRRDLPFTTTNTQIRTFRHALSLDERRVRFQPSLYHRPAPTPEDAAKDPNVASRARTNGRTAASQRKGRNLKSRLGSLVSKKPRADASHLVDEETAVQETAEIDDDVIEGGTDVHEVWFAGCHSDVGGGAVKDTVPRSLADISLRWMVGQILAANCMIKWRPGVLDVLLNPATNSEAGGNASSSRPDLDSLDALQPLHDPLKKKPVWWILEFLPLSWTWQDEQGKWHRQWRFNMGRGRHIEGVPTIHHTVRERMDNVDLKYKPKAVWKGSQSWV